MQEQPAMSLPNNLLEQGQSAAMDDDFQKDMKRIDALRTARDLAGMEKTANQIQEKWSKRNDMQRAMLLLNVCEALNSVDFRSNHQYELAQKYAKLALGNFNTLPINLELRLVLCLTSALKHPNGEAARQEWARQRSETAQLWLHAWHRLEQEIDRNFNFNDLPMLNVSPPEGANVPAGVTPEAIKDPKLRATYEAAIEKNRHKIETYNKQHEMKKWDRLFHRHAEAYIVAAYSITPLNLDELRHYLDIYHIDEQAKLHILKEVSSTTEH